MFALLFLVTAFYSSIAVLAFYNFYYKRRALPPGPAPLPFIGNLWTLMKHLPGEDIYLKWRNEYGPVFTYWLGEFPIVCVADYDTIVQTFQKDGDAYAGRPIAAEFDRLFKGGTYGVIMMEGAEWREHRRFALHIFRDFGVGKNLMQERILTEVTTLLERIEAEENAMEVDVARHIDIGVGSIINVIVFGERFDGPREKQFYRLKIIVQQLMDFFGAPTMHLIQWNPQLLIHLPYFRDFWRRFKVAGDIVDAHIGEQIATHLAELEAGGGMSDEAPADYVQAFLQEKSRRDALGERHSFSIEQLKWMCFDLWVAGQETSSTTLTWAVAYLVKHPQFQAKLHEELDRVISSERVISVTDRAISRPHLPYTCAVINEAQRMANLLAQNVLHRTTRDVKINGFTVKAGSIVVPQISVVLSDPANFDDPKRFNPDRLIDPTTGQLVKFDEFITFSAGKRQCLGEPLARMELFLFLANLFNQYECSPSPQGGFPQLTRTHGTISAPVQCPHFTCQVTKRHR